MSETFLYFAYGSNMSHKRLQHINRAPSAKPMGRAYLVGYKLVFDKVSKADSSAKADCQKQEGFTVWGGLYTVLNSERRSLDRAEGLGHGYKEDWVKVHMDDGNAVLALTYIATDKQPNLRPFTWYVRHVLIGASDFSLPDDYINNIQAVDVITDRDSARVEKELSIYS